MNPPIRSPLDELGLNLTRRRFFEQGSHLLGGVALASLAAQDAARGAASSGADKETGKVSSPNFSMLPFPSRLKTAPLPSCTA